MAIMDTILSTPVDIAALRTTGAPLERLLDGTFTNFLYYAKSNWSYVASATAGGEALLAGTAQAAPCGGIATALMRIYIDGLGIDAADVEYKTVPGYLWTGPEYSCFDPKVYGNLRKLDGRDYRNGCIFNQHYYLKCHGKYYDPCLSTTYRKEDESIKEKFQGGGTRVIVAGTHRKILVTLDRKTVIMHMHQESVPGFRGAWAMFDASKKNIEKAMGSTEFKTEMAVRRGETEFAKYVATLG